MAEIDALLKEDRRFPPSRHWQNTAHVIDPAYRVPPWVVFDLKLRAVEEGCVNPALKARGLARGQRPDLEEELLRAVPLGAVTLTTTARVSVLLSNGANLDAQVVKFSAPITLDAQNKPLKDSGRDLALLQVERHQVLVDLDHLVHERPMCRLDRREVRFPFRVEEAIDDALAAARRQVDRQAFLSVGCLDRAEQGGKVDVLGVDLVDDDEAAQAALAGPLHHPRGDHLDAGLRVDHHGHRFHRVECAAVARMRGAGRPEADVHWGDSTECRVTLVAESFGRPHLLADLTEAIALEGAEIVSATVEPPSQQRVRHTYTLELPDAAHLPTLMRAMRNVPGVYDVSRAQHHAGAH